MSWRDDTSQAVQDDLDRLTDEALTAARDLLEHQRGEFYPFALDLDAEREVGLLNADPGEGERPSSQAVLDMLHETAGHLRDGHTAFAFVTPVVTDRGDAVQVALEHRDGGPALEVFLPFSRRFRRMRYGELWAGDGVRRVWS
jgi:hypothetical protein